MAVYKCKMCGAGLQIAAGMTVCTCAYCDTQQTLPRLTDDRRANLYDRANHFRRNTEFDKATGIYEQILSEDTTDAEAYWSLVLCRYGIEYVEDPFTHKRMPTINRAQYTSIFDDANYRAALQYADVWQKGVYEQEAQAINEIQKRILSISQSESPYDVFICYKETDQSGRRTIDSVLATDLYQELTRDGYKVFFARITLEDKLGQEYEPYIFAALHSAKVMVVLGTKPEHFNAVWVKNEWSRYLSLIRGGERKMLIPAYKDMSPYDLPEEFAHLQAQDMNKLGFMQDLVRGIGKVVGQPTAAASGSNQPTTASLLKRVQIFLGDAMFAEANEYCNKVLDIDPENGEAYVGQLLAALRCATVEELKGQYRRFDHLPAYRHALRYADDDTVTKLSMYNKLAAEREASAPAPSAPTPPSAPAAFGDIGGSYTVILQDSGAGKISVIKVIREITGLGLKEAKDLVDSAPKIMKTGVSMDHAQAIKAKLESVGARVEIR